MTEGEATIFAYSQRVVRVVVVERSEVDRAGLHLTEVDRASLHFSRARREAQRSNLPFNVFSRDSPDRLITPGKLHPGRHVFDNL